MSRKTPPGDCRARRYPSSRRFRRSRDARTRPSSATPAPIVVRSATLRTRRGRSVTLVDLPLDVQVDRLVPGLGELVLAARLHQRPLVQVPNGRGGAVQRSGGRSSTAARRRRLPLDVADRAGAVVGDGGQHVLERGLLLRQVPLLDRQRPALATTTTAIVSRVHPAPTTTTSILLTAASARSRSCLSVYLTSWARLRSPAIWSAAALEPASGRWRMAPGAVRDRRARNAAASPRTLSRLGDE